MIRRPLLVLAAALGALDPRTFDADVLPPIAAPPREPRTIADLARPAAASWPFAAPQRGRKRGEAKRIRGTRGRVRYRKRVRVDGRKVAVVTRRRPA